MKDTIKAGLFVAVCAAALFIGMYITNTWLLPRLIGTEPTRTAAGPEETKPARLTVYTPPPAAAPRRTDNHNEPQTGRRLYLWTDAEGIKHISDQAPPEGTPNVTSRPLP